MLRVHVLDRLADLTHEDGAGALGQHEVVADDPLEQLATFDAGGRVRRQEQSKGFMALGR